jgi:hypothetical protein
MTKIRSKLTYSNVMVTVLAFIVLGGTAYAATELGKESVGTKQLKNGAVTKAKIAKGAQNALKGQTGPAGQKGATGATGAQGPKGDTGARGSDASAILLARVNGVTQTTTTSFGSPSGTSTATATVGNVTMLGPFTTAVKVDGFSIQTTAPIGLVGCGVPGACLEIVSLLVNGEAALACVIPFGGVICTSGAASATIPAGAQVAIRAQQVIGSTGNFDMQVALHTSPT